jgi:hypothetical protein
MLPAGTRTLVVFPEPKISEAGVQSLSDDLPAA